MDALAPTLPTLAMNAHGHPVQSLAFNGKGDLLATGDTSRHLRAWFNSQPFFEADVRSRTENVKSTDRIRGVAFSPDARRLYVASGDTLRAFDLLTRQELWRFIPPRSFGFLIVSPVAVTVSPAGNVVTCTDAGVIYALDSEGRHIAKWWDNEAPRHLAFTPDSLSIVGADGFSVSVWDAYTGRTHRRVRSKERIFGMAVASLTGTLAIRTLHRVELKDLETLETFHQMVAPTGLPLMAFSPDGNLLALGGKEEVLLFRPGAPYPEILPTLGARVLSLSFHPAGSFLAAGCSDGVVRFWDVFAGPSVK
jgi:WD40 repeat protein